MIFLRLDEARALSRAVNDALENLYTPDGHRVKFKGANLDQCGCLLSTLVGHPVLIEGVIPIIINEKGEIQHLLTMYPTLPRGNSNGKAGTDFGGSTGVSGDEDGA